MDIMYMLQLQAIRNAYVVILVYNGYHVHAIVLLSMTVKGCNPCYNGYHVHEIAKFKKAE